MNRQSFKYVYLLARALFSLSFVRYLVERFAYNLFEGAVWRVRIQAHRTARIHATASIRNPHNVTVGKNSHINLNCCVWAGRTSRIVLGDNLLMGPCVQLHASRHGLVAGTPMTQQALDYADIVVGNDVWLCAGSIITAGVSIADGVVVAANAVVTKSIAEENVIVAGVPARIIGRRPSGCAATPDELDRTDLLQ